MSDLETPGELDDDNAVIRGLREKANRTDAAESEALAAKRELTLHRAGLGALTDKQIKALNAAHEGDWEPELLKATADELGFVQPTNDATPPPTVPVEELAAHQRVAAAAGGQPPPPPDLEAAIRAATSPEEIKTLLANAGRLAE